MTLAQDITKRFNGDWHGDYGAFPTPGHSPSDRGTTVKDDPGAPDGVLINSFNGGDPIAIKDQCREWGILPGRDGDHPKPIYETFAGLMSGRIETEGRTIGNAFQSGASMVDICNIIRLGLIGGGMSDAHAAKLVRENEPPHRPLNDLWEIAAALVYATLCGVEEAASD